MMRRAWLALVSVALLTPVLLRGQAAQPTFTAGDRTEIETVVRGYFAAFTAKDKTLLVESAEFLIMSKVSGTWKIAGVMPHQLPLFGR